MTVREIIADWLKSHGYDGLYWDSDSDEGCGCAIDDLAPCDNINLERCHAGYKCKVKDEDGNLVDGIGPEKGEWGIE